MVRRERPLHDHQGRSAYAASLRRGQSHGLRAPGGSELRLGASQDRQTRLVAGDGARSQDQCRGDPLAVSVPVILRWNGEDSASDSQDSAAGDRRTQRPIADNGQGVLMSERQVRESIGQRLRSTVGGEKVGHAPLSTTTAVPRCNCPQPRTVVIAVASRARGTPQTTRATTPRRTSPEG